MGHAKSRFENAFCSNSLFENQAFRSSFCIRTKKISEHRDCLFALPVNKKEVINQKNTFLFEFCSRSTLFGCCLFLPDDIKRMSRCFKPRRTLELKSTQHMLVFVMVHTTTRTKQPDISKFRRFTLAFPGKVCQDRVLF